MRKKLLAITLCVMVAVSCMPTMAFATEKSNSYDGHRYPGSSTGTYSNIDVENLVEDEKASEYVVDYKYATCTEDGYVTLKCTKKENGVACDATKTFTIAAEHTWSDQRVDVTLDELETAALEQKLMTKYEIAEFKAENENLCFARVYYCVDCGAYRFNKTEKKVEGTTGTNGYGESTFTEYGIEFVNHYCSKTTAYKCESNKSTCINCQKVYDNGKDGHTALTLNSEAAPSGYKNLKYVGAANCGLGAHYTVVCEECGETVDAYLGNPDSSNKKHTFETALTAAEYDALKDAQKANYVKVWSGKWTANATKYIAKEWEGKITNTNLAQEQNIKEATGQTVNMIAGNEYTLYDRVYVYYAGICTETKEKTGFVKCTTCNKWVEITDVDKEIDKAVATDTNLQAPDTGCDHAWTTVNIDATCSHAAYSVEQCSKCGYYKDVNGDADKDLEDAKQTLTGTDKLGHDITITTTDATCTEAGTYVIKCSKCGANLVAVSNNNPANKAIDMGDIQSVSLEESTVSGCVCIVIDGVNYNVTAAKAATGHKFTSYEKFADATCTTPEVWAKKCENCDKFNIHNGIKFVGKALGHDEEVKVVAPTCTEKGYTVKVCKTCGEETSGHYDYVAALGGAHVYDKWVVTKKATAFEEGTMELTCSRCGDKYGNIAPVAKKAVAKSTAKAGKGKVTVTVKKVAGATSYTVKAGKKVKTVTKAGKVVLKVKKGTRKVTVTATNGTATVTALSKNVKVK